MKQYAPYEHPAWTYLPMAIVFVIMGIVIIKLI